MSTFQVEVISESSLQGAVYEAVLIHGNFIKSVYQQQVDDKVLATDLIYFQFTGNSFMEKYNLTLDFKLSDVPKVKIFCFSFSIFWELYDRLIITVTACPWTLLVMNNYCGILNLVSWKLQVIMNLHVFAKMQTNLQTLLDLFPLPKFCQF